MMNRAGIVERLAAGEVVTPAEVAQLRAADELADLQRQADALAAERRREAEAAARRDATFAEAVEAARQAEAAALAFVGVQAERDAQTRRLDALELASRESWYTAHRKFDSLCRQLTGGQASDSTHPRVAELLAELRRRGVSPDRAAENVGLLPSSASVLELLREREAAERNAR